MARPIWKGSISFGLVNIPVTLYSAEKKKEALHFHLLDAKNHARIRYEKINETTGKPVPLKDIVKAYEFEKANYVIVDEKELEKTAGENSQLVEIEDFVEQKSIEPFFYEKPYYLLPIRQGGKGYKVLKETLEKTKKVGIAKFVIRTKQYLVAIFPYKDVLVLNILRYYKDVKQPEELEVPEKELTGYKVSPKEIEMAERLIKSMSSKWNPKKYHDENKELLSGWIQKKIKGHKTVSTPEKKEIASIARGSKGKVVDFMELLKKSIDEKEKRSSIKKKGRSAASTSRSASTSKTMLHSKKRKTKAAK